jgi:hypothetical protein
MPKETWVALIIMTVIILYSTVLTLYLMVTGRITTLLPVLVGNATSQGNTLKVTVMAFGATYRITGITLQGKSGVVACRLTGVFINNTQASLTPPWVLKNGQSLVFMLSDCASVSQVVVTYNSGRELIIPITG